MSAAPLAASRVPNLDLLRALAILPVVLCNAATEHVLTGTLGRLADSGWVGVDLFFVLSGWLVGGLYWRERQDYGNIEVGRFWARRWLRTIPPYLVALAVVYGARVWVTGAPEAFDGRYLAFVQNYTGLPYWGVSWSLCVEEHFYLALPIVLGLATRIRGGVPVVLGLAALGSLAARVLTVPDGASAWGLGYTETHMRLEGLALGVAAAWVYTERREWWPGVQRVARWLLVPGLAFVASVPWLPLDVLNRFAYAGVDVAFVALLVCVVDRKALPLASSRVVNAIALTSYSVYMTQATSFDAYGRLVGEALPGVPEALHLVGALVLVGAVGAAFYAVIERPTLWLRRRVAPRRSGVLSPALVTSPEAPALP